MSDPITSPAEDGAGRTNEHRIRDLQWLVAYLDHTCAVRPLTEKDIRQLIAAESRAAAAEAEVARLRELVEDWKATAAAEAEIGNERQASASALRDRVKVLEEANTNLHIAFMVLSESGHGGGMCEVRRWFNSGTEKPIPWPGGALFAAWAAAEGIVNRNGYARFAALTQGGPNADAS